MYEILMCSLFQRAKIKNLDIFVQTFLHIISKRQGKINRDESSVNVREQLQPGPSCTAKVFVLIFTKSNQSDLVIYVE